MQVNTWWTDPKIATRNGEPKVARVSGKGPRSAGPSLPTLRDFAARLRIEHQLARGSQGALRRTVVHLELAAELQRFGHHDLAVRLERWTVRRRNLLKESQKGRSGVGTPADPIRIRIFVEKHRTKQLTEFAGRPLPTAFVIRIVASGFGKQKVDRGGDAAVSSAVALGHVTLDSQFGHGITRAVVRASTRKNGECRE